MILYSFLQLCRKNEYICVLLIKIYKMQAPRLLTILSLVVILFSTSCKKDEPEDPEIPNEEEVITTLIMTLTPDSSGNEIKLSFKDLDGDGGNNPVITIDTLQVNTTYTAEIELLNETESPAEVITEEVEEEAEEHQFFYDNTTSGLQVSYKDSDKDGNPVGLLTTVMTGDSTQGTLTVTLRHEPNKSAAGVAAGDITNAGGETDIEVEFPIYVR